MRRLVLALVLGGLALASCGGQVGPGNDPTFSFATAPSSRPPDGQCFGSEGSVAKELINIRTFEIVVAAGEHPMSDQAWADFRPRLPWSKNSTRFLLFDEGCFFRSPGAPAACVGAACLRFVEAFDHTWLLLTTLVNTSCLPDASGCSGDEVKPGFVSVNTIDKCQQLIFAGPMIYDLTDPDGNRYVMHATATGTPTTAGVQLPAGWQLAARTLSEPLVVDPVGGGTGCYYNIVRDNLAQSYHQYRFAGERWP